MTTELIAYLGRDNEERVELLQDKVLVAAGTVTRAVLKFGSYCIDSDVDTDEIYFTDADRQIVGFKIGLVENLAVGKYRRGQLTIWDELSTNGIAWSLVDVTVKPWAICPVG